jgi:hypothetical protein
MVGEPRGYRYVSFDDDAVLAAARHDPVGFVARLPAKTILPTSSVPNCSVPQSGH